MPFTTITAGQTDADSPLDQALMDLIRTNLDDLDADRVTNGDTHDHIGGDGNPITDGAFNDLTAGTTNLIAIAIQNEGITSSGSLIAIEATIIPILRTGAYTISWLMKNTSGTAHGKIYKNGVALGTEKTTGSSTYTLMTDTPLSFSAGDYLELWARASGGGSAEVKDLKIESADVFLG